MGNKERYREFCKENSGIPIFSKDWWLDAVCGPENWDVAMVAKGDSVVATMPYTFKRKYGFVLLGMPFLTQTLGPWLRSSPGKYAKKLTMEKDCMESLIEQLPHYDYFNQCFHYSVTNWLPFYWKGFKQTTRYTYVLEDLSDTGRIWEGFLDNIRREIRKAESRFGLAVRSDMGIESFLKVTKKTFQRQGMNLPYPVEIVYKIERACERHNCKKILFAVDREGNIHAAFYIVWDENSAYYLMGGGDPVLRKSGATSLLMWEAIKFASTVTSRFDFEGSMIESVERFFRSFGAKQIPYYEVTNTQSRLLQLIKKFCRPSNDNL
ncbi:MAG: GNAT family N-acetyltransferase [Candidatus Hodarchaeota archaeon]